MHLPHHMNEKDVLACIERVVSLLGHRFSFPGYDAEDIEQEGRIMALEALPRYDPRPDADGRPTRPLANFLMAHVRRRLLNLKRDHYRRSDAPCKACHAGTEHERDRRCEVYAEWKARNDAKAKLARPLDISGVGDGHAGTRVESDVAATAEMNEMLGRIDRHLDVELRAAYLQMRAGKSVPRDRRVAVEHAVRHILGDAVA